MIHMYIIYKHIITYYTMPYLYVIHTQIPIHMIVYDIIYNVLRNAYIYYVFAPSAPCDLAARHTCFTGRSPPSAPVLASPTHPIHPRRSHTCASSSPARGRWLIGTIRAYPALAGWERASTLVLETPTSNGGWKSKGHHQVDGTLHCNPERDALNICITGIFGGPLGRGPLITYHNHIDMNRPHGRFGREDGAVGNPHRAQISRFELFELILLLKLDRQLPVEQFEAAVSQSTVPSPPPYRWWPQLHAGSRGRGLAFGGSRWRSSGPRPRTHECPKTIMTGTPFSGGHICTSYKQ